MSFWSKLGRGLLKAAPIAAGFIPGIGPIASMAIGAGASALDKKTSGGSWGDAAKSGLIGGGIGYLSGKVGDRTTSKPGIGPSNPSAYVGKDVAGVANRVAGNGGGGGFGRALDIGLAASPLLGMMGSKGGSSAPGNQGGFGEGVYGGGGDFGNFDYRNPDLGAAINRGRQQAIGPSPQMRAPQMKSRRMGGVDY